MPSSCCRRRENTSSGVVKKTQIMDWKSEHDCLLLEEIIVSEPYRFKPSTRERGQVWEEIADRLNATTAFSGKLKQKRSVRDRYTLLSKKYKKKMSHEEKDTGTSPEPTEIDKLLEEITAKFEECDASTAEKSDKKEQDREKATEMRKRSMEKLGETKQRSENKEMEDGESTPKRKRSSGTETLVYLKEKSEQTISIRKEELEVKKKDQDMQEKMYAESQKQQLLLVQQQTNLFQQMQQQQHQQQKQQQHQQQLYHQQMMMQTKLLTSLIEKLNQ